MLKRGWLEKQSKIASEDISRWEPWMRREAGLDSKSHTVRVESKSLDKKKK